MMINRGKGSNIVQVKNHNRQAILLQLLRAPLSRVELAKKLRLTSMTVSNLVNELIEDGWICLQETAVSQKPAQSKSVGRPRKTLCIKGDAGYTIGIQIGIGTVRLGIVNLIGNIVHQSELQFDIAESATAVLNQIAQEIASLISHSSIERDKILGIGVGASGLVDSESGCNVTAPSLQWHNVHISHQLQHLTNLPVTVENNVRAMALGEAYFGQGQDVESLAFIYGRVGVGAGIIMNRTLFRGVQAGAGEIGHTIIMPNGGELCRCGQTGCLETLITQPVLEQQLSKILKRPLDSTQTDVERFNDILTRAPNNAVIRKNLQTIGQYLGIALVNLVNTLNPERIIIGGMYMQGADSFLPILQEMVKEKSFGDLGKQIKISATQFGLNAGIVGAASVALIKLFYKKSLP